MTKEQKKGEKLREMWETNNIHDHLISRGVLL